MATNTRENLIMCAHDLFYHEGFHSVGLDRILESVGITKTTFYNHFSSKDDLVLEALKWHDTWWQQTFRKMLREHGGDAPRGQLLAIPAVINQLMTSDEFNGCIFVNVAVEFPLAHDPAHKMAARHKASMEDILREIAGYAGAPDAKGLAEELALVMEGSYVTRHVTGRRDTCAVLSRLVEMILDRHMPGSAG